MKLCVYTVFDLKAKVYGSPFYAHSDEIAIRNCAAMVGDPIQGGMLARFPEDFHLYRLGSFDDDTGAFDLETPSVICNLINLQRRV